MIRFFRKYAHFIVFSAFFAVQAVIMHMIPAFGDDYYYGTFFYGGFDRFVSENVKHYRETNGRALVHLLDEGLLAGHQMLAFHIFNTLVVAGIVFLLARIGAKTWKREENDGRFSPALIVSCFLFATISLEIARQSIYWATGSVNYLFPIFLLLLCFYLLRRGSEKRYSAWLLPLLFVSAWSIEQCSAALVAVVVYTMVEEIKNKKKCPFILFAYLFVTLAGAALLFLAPGNAVRMTYYPEFFAKPFWDRIYDNILPVANGVTAPWGMGTAAVLLLACDAGEELRRLSEKKFVSVPFLLVDAAAILPTLFLLENETYREARVILLTLGLVVYTAKKGLSYLFGKGDGDLAFFPLIAGILQICMLASPEYGGRIILVSVVLLFVPILRMIAYSENRAFLLLPMALCAAVLLDFGWLMLLLLGLCAAGVLFALLCQKPKAAAAVLLLVLTLFCFDRLWFFVCGYVENVPVYEANEEQIENWKETGDETVVLPQFYAKNMEFKYTLPYNNIPYHWYWYKIYNKLPENVQMQFFVPGE